MMADSGFPPPPARLRLGSEARLVLACAWVPEGPAALVQAERVADLCRAGVDWPSVLDLVDRHRLRALAHLNLNRHGRAWVPAPVLARLADGAARERTRALRLGAECLRLVRRFNGAGLPVVPLGGALLSWQLHGDPALRQARAVDLLVRETDLRQALGLLAAEGYQVARPDGPQPSSGTPEPFLADPGRRHLGLWHPGREIRVELHRGLGAGGRAEPPATWASLRREAWLGVPVALLPEAVLLAHLCGHGARHGWRRGAWLADVAALLVRKPAPDPGARVAAARSLDLARPLAQAALLAHWLYDLALAPDLAELVRREPRSRPLALLALERLGAPGPRTLGQRLGRLAYPFLLHPPGTLAYRLRCRLAPAPAWGLRILPGWLHPPYRLLLRLAARRPPN